MRIVKYELKPTSKNKVELTNVIIQTNTKE